jgi:UDP-N-acetylmuramoyl-tripeptide--D-alanyl-D-alanine ligase
MAKTPTLPAPPTAKEIRAAIDGGVRFLLRSQRADGAFHYEYDWKKKTYSSNDNSVRQAGALWGLALAYQHDNEPKLLAACARSLEFFENHSALTSSGGRFVKYPKSAEGLMGVIALLALALIDLLRSPGDIDDATDRLWRTTLDEYLRFLLDGQNERGLWHSKYDPVDGTPYGEPSAFFDGEALLALIKAVKYMDYGHLRDYAMVAAATGYRRNILLALNRPERKKSIARGYYQWGTMSFCELIDSNWPDAEQYVEPVYYLADMRARSRASDKNQGAILEGLIHAYAVARIRDMERAEHYRNLIIRDVQGMLSLQVGNSAALNFLTGSECDESAIGGFQHYPDNPTLRIDFTQHALHALMLGIRQKGLID